MNYKPLLSIIIISVASLGCATPYQSRGLTGGYTESMLDENKYKINFVGNNFTSALLVENYLLLRASELTLENEYTHFVVLDESGDVNTSYKQSRTGTVNSSSSHRKSLQIIMLSESEMSEEDKRNSINAEIYWAQNKPKS